MPQPDSVCVGGGGGPRSFFPPTGGARARGGGGGGGGGVPVLSAPLQGLPIYVNNRHPIAAGSKLYYDFGGMAEVPQDMLSIYSIDLPLVL